MSAQKASRRIVFVRPIEVDTETNQVCPQCRQWKQENEMSSTPVSGKKVCKDCHKVYVEQMVQDGKFQQCRECKEYKDLNEFHRRGADHQRVCKACRKAHVPSENKRIVWLNRSEHYIPLSQRINALEQRLRAMSGAMSNSQLDADDIYGAMIDEILFKSKIEDSDARILTRAKWAAKAVLRRNAAYNMYVADESEMTVENEDGETDVDVRFACSKSAEEEYEIRECNAHILEIIGQLEPRYREIVSMIALGHTQREVSSKMKISEQSISFLIKKIAVELRSHGISNA